MTTEQDDEANWAGAEEVLARWRPEPAERRLAAVQSHRDAVRARRFLDEHPDPGS